jgi:hypothetical protein
MTTICNFLLVSRNTKGWILQRISLLVFVSSHEVFSDSLFTSRSNWRDILMSWIYSMSSPRNVVTTLSQAQTTFPCNCATYSPIRYCYIMMRQQTTVRKDTLNRLTLSSPDLVLYVNVREASACSKMHGTPSFGSLYRLMILLGDVTVVSERPTT